MTKKDFYSDCDSLVSDGIGHHGITFSNSCQSFQEKINKYFLWRTKFISKAIVGRLSKKILLNPEALIVKSAEKKHGLYTIKLISVLVGNYQNMFNYYVIHVTKSNIINRKD